MRRRHLHQTARDALFERLFKSRDEGRNKRVEDVNDLTGKVFFVGEAKMEEENTKETKRRRKRDTVMPQTVTGWSVLLVAVLCATGVTLVALKEREVALLLFGVAGWGGYITKLVGGERR